MHNLTCIPNELFPTSKESRFEISLERRQEFYFIISFYNMLDIIKSWKNGYAISISAVVSTRADEVHSCRCKFAQ